MNWNYSEVKEGEKLISVGINSFEYLQNLIGVRVLQNLACLRYFELEEDFVA